MYEHSELNSNLHNLTYHINSVEVTDGFSGTIHCIDNKSIIFLYGTVSIHSTAIWQTIATLQVKPKEHMFFYVDSISDSSGTIHKKRFTINTAGNFQMASNDFSLGETFFFNEFIPLLIQKLGIQKNHTSIMQLLNHRIC